MRGRVRTRAYTGERPDVGSGGARPRGAPSRSYDKRQWLLGKIHGVAKRRGLGDAERYRLQLELTGVESCADMSERQLVQVLQALQGAEGREASGVKRLIPIGDTLAYMLTDPSRLTPLASRSGRDERQPDEPVTCEQLAKIEHLRSHVRLFSSEAWMGFCRRVIRRPWPQTRAEGNKVIEALKAMDARGWRAREAAHV